MNRGPLLMMAAALFFSLMVACVKVLRAELSTFDIILWRSALSLPMAMWAVRREPSWRLNNPRVFALRAACGVLAMTGFYTAAKGLTLADLSLVGRLQPLCIAVLAPLVLGAGERPQGRTLGLLGAGLLGCGILLGPQLALGNRYGAIALGAVLAGACAHTALRALGATDRPGVVVLHFQWVGLVVALAAVFVLQGGPELPPLGLLAPLLGVGTFAFVGQLLLTRAFAADRAARVSAASHVSPVWAVLLDVLLFGVLPGWNALVGGGIVLAAALLLVVRGPSAPPDTPGSSAAEPEQATGIEAVRREP